MSYSLSTVFGLVGLGVVMGAGALLLGIHLGRRSDVTVTRYHLPAIALVVLAVTVGITAVAGAESLEREIDRVDYSVQSCEESTYSPPNTDQQIQAFRDLSPPAQDIFLSALRTEGEYSSPERPSEFDYSSDTPELNFVRYDSECYVLQAWGAGPLAGLGIYVLLVFGGSLALLLLCVGTGSLVWPRFKLPLSVLAGLTGTVLLVNAVSLGGRQFLAVFVALPLLAWLALWALERRLDWQFRERMER